MHFDKKLQILTSTQNIGIDLTKDYRNPGKIVFDETKFKIRWSVILRKLLRCLLRFPM